MSEPRLSLLGNPQLRLDDGASVPFIAERRFQLLAYLALNGDWVERDRLAGLFWPEHDNAAARRCTGRGLSVPPHWHHMDSVRIRQGAEPAGGPDRQQRGAQRRRQHADHGRADHGHGR
jgi:hypothetical protein